MRSSLENLETFSFPVRENTRMVTANQAKACEGCARYVATTKRWIGYCKDSGNGCRFRPEGVLAVTDEREGQGEGQARRDMDPMRK